MRALFICCLVAVASLACGRTYQDLGTFPCAQTNFCPDPMVCLKVNDSPLCVPPLTCSPTAATTGCVPGNTQDINSRARCTVMQTGPGLVETQCVHESAPVLGEGSPCQLQFPTGNGLSGSAFPINGDNCADGTICHNLEMGHASTSLGVASKDGVCRKFCETDNDCTGGARCFDAFNTLVTTTAVTVQISPRLGVCLATCTPLHPSDNGGCGASEECNVGSDIAANTGMGICQPPGRNAAEGAYCDASLVCNAGMSCVTTGLGTAVCEKMCRLTDASSPCGSGKTCIRSQLVLPDADIGFCQ